MKRRRKQKVFCDGCAHLLYIPGLPPQCVATAEFVEGPLRRRINVVGRAPAEKRNAHNDCTYREPVSLRAYHLKKWILWRANDEGRRDEIKEADLREYSVKEEDERAKVYRETGDESLVQSLIDEEEQDALLLVGDVGGDDESGTDDQGSDGGDEYSGGSGGSEGERVPQDGD